MDAKRWQFERWAVVEFRKALRATVKPVIDAPSVYDALQIVDNLESDAIAKAFGNVYGRVGAYFALSTQRSIKSRGGVFETKSTETVFDRLIRAWIAVYGAERVRDVTLTTIRRLKVSLQDAFNNGDGIEVVARNIVRSGSGIADVKRARVIARTEIISASNKGSLEGARDTGIPLRKEWLATMDDRTRDAHLSADGQKVLLDELFVVDGEDMQFPGDFTQGASAGNVINCRCTQIYEPITGTNVGNTPIPLAPLDNVSYTGDKVIIDRYKNDIEQTIKQLGIKKNLNIIFKNEKGKGKGYVSWIKDKDGNLTIGEKVVVRTDLGDETLLVLKHELRHQWQAENNKFQATKDGYYYWDGRNIMSFAQYRRIVKNATKTVRGFNRYTSLPWEKDADNFAGITYDPKTGRMTKNNNNFDIIDLIPLPPGGDEIADEQEQAGDVL